MAIEAGVPYTPVISRGSIVDRDIVHHIIRARKPKVWSFFRQGLKMGKLVLRNVCLNHHETCNHFWKTGSEDGNLFIYEEILYGACVEGERDNEERSHIDRPCSAPS